MVEKDKGYKRVAEVEKKPRENHWKGKNEFKINNNFNKLLEMMN